MRYCGYYSVSSSLEVCQNFQEALPTLRSVGVVHWARAVASVLDVYLQASTLQVRLGEVR